MSHLNRTAAPFPPELWEKIDAAAVKAARDLITARRFLPVDGPHGIGLTALELGADDLCRQSGEEAGAILGRAVSVPMFRKAFLLSIRRLEAQAQASQPLDLTAVEAAAEAVARREEQFIYYGRDDFGLQGLITAAGRHQSPIGDWARVDQALEDVLKAVNLLDGAGFRGPYALALSPMLYNCLFRRYEGSDMLQLEHLTRLCSLGVFKAPIEGGVVVEPHAGSIVIGQDLSAGYSHQDGIHHHLYLSESAVLLLQEGRAICVLGG